MVSTFLSNYLFKHKHILFVFLTFFPLCSLRKPFILGYSAAVVIVARIDPRFVLNASTSVFDFGGVPCAHFVVYYSEDNSGIGWLKTVDRPTEESLGGAFF
jgi:hypothetical protein